MNVESGKIEGRSVLSEDLKLTGMWIGNCHVQDGAHLSLHGLMTGDLVVDDDASASISGTVSGNVTAHGLVEIAGMVNGRVSGPGLRLHMGASVGGLIVP